MSVEDKPSDSTQDLPAKPHSNSASATYIAQVASVEVAAESASEFRGPQEIGKYRLHDEIGRGGMGVVYSALDTELNRTVALKVLPVASQLDPQCQKRFRNESRAAAQLSHPNIVPVYEVGDHQGTNYYSMQYIQGQNLSVVVKQIRSELLSSHSAGRTTAQQALAATTPDRPRRRSGSGTRRNDSDESHSRSFAADSYALTGRAKQLTSTMSLCRSVAELGAEVASGLQHAHDQSIVHRDMKPSNLILDPSGKVWITDFGLAQIRNAPAITQTGVLLGTLRYMSPEQASGHRAFVDHRTDIYSLGVTLYELLTLKRAFDGRRTEDILRQIAFERPASIRSLNASVPADLQTIVEKAMAHAPHDRYETAQDLADDLVCFVRGEPISARRPTVAQKVRFWGNRHPKAVTGIIGTAAALLMTSVAAAGIFFVAFEKEQQQKEIVERKLDESEGLRLAANSVLEVNEDPHLAMELAALSTERFPSLEASQAWLRASDANHEYALVMTDKSQFGGLAMSPDGSRVLAFASPRTSSDVARNAVVYEMDTGKSLLTLDNKTGITTAAISPRGAFIVTSASLGITRTAKDQNVNRNAATAILWNGANGQRLHKFADTAVHRAHAGLFDPTGQRLVLPQNSEAVVFNTDRLQPELTLRGHAGDVVDAAFSQDGSLILTVGRDSTVRVWNAQSGAPLEKFGFEGEWQSWHTAAFNRNQSAVIMATATGDFLFPLDGDPETSQPMQVEEQRRLQVGVTQSLVAAFWQSGTEISIIDDQTLASISTLHVPEGIESVEFLAQQAGVLVRGDRRFYLFDAYTGQQLKEFKGHTESILDIAAAPDGNRICTVGSDDTLRFWNVRSGRDQRTFAADRDDWVPQQIAISQRGEKVAIGSVKETTVQMFRRDGTQLPGQLQGMIQSSDPDSEMPVTTEGPVVTVWDPQSSRIVARRHFPCEQVQQVEVGADSKTLFVIPDTGRAFLWSLADDRISRLPDHQGDVRNMDITADKTHMILGCSSGQVLVLDTATHSIKHSYMHSSGVLDVEFAADGKRFLSVDRNGNTIVRELGNENPLCEFKSEPRTSLKGRFTNNGSQIVMVGIMKDDPVDVWDAESGEHLRSLGKALSIAPRNVVVHPVQPLVAIRSNSASTQLINTLDGTVVTLKDGGANLLAFLDDALVTVTWPGRQQWETPDESTGAAQAASDRLSEMKTWNLQTHELLSTTALRGAPQWLDVDAVTRNIFLVSDTWRATVFDAAATTARTRTPGHSSELVFAGFSAQDRHLITMSLHGHVQVLNGDGDQLERELQHDRFLHCGSLSSDGDLLAAGDSSGNVVLWKIANGERVRSQKLHQGPVRRLMFDSHGHRTLSWADATEVAVWDLRTDQATAWSAEGHIRHAELSKNGKHLLIISSQRIGNPEQMVQPVTHDVALLLAGEANQAVLVDLDAGVKTQLQQPGGSVGGHFAPGDGSVVLLSTIGELQRFDLKNSAPPQPIAVAELTPDWFQFSPDGSVMMLAQPNLISVWDVATNTELIRDGNDHQLITEPYFIFDPLNRFAVVNGVTCLKMPWSFSADRRVRRALSKTEKSRLRLDLLN